MTSHPPYRTTITIVLCACAGMLLALPALWMGYSQDDHIFRMTFRGAPGLEEMHAAPWNTYCFSDGDPARIQSLMNRGVFPWWTAEHWRVNFFRPLAALSIYFDYKVFGDVPFFMHLHSVMLLGALIVAVGFLYRRIMRDNAAACVLATLFYAVSGAHGIPAAWISHRNSLYAVLFATLSLLAHIAYRDAASSQSRRRANAYLLTSLALFALALFSAELALGFLGYFIAYAIFLDDSSPKPLRPNATALRAFSSLSGVLSVGMVWLALYLATGHGAKGSWFYIDPSKNPLHFFRETSERYPVLLSGLLSGLDSLLYALWSPSGKWMHLGVALAAIVYVGWAIRPLLRTSAQARFWIFGALVSLAPICAAMPSSRLLQTSGIGGLAVMALVIVDIWRNAPWIASTGLRRIATRLLLPWFIVANLIVSPGVFEFSLLSIGVLGGVEDQLVQALPETADDNQRIIVINTPLDAVGIMPPITRSAENKPVPKHWLCLHAGDGDTVVERIDATRLRVSSDDYFVNRPCSQLFRDPVTHPFHKGEIIALPGTTITIEDVSEDGRPASVIFALDRPLDDPSIVWLALQDARYVPFALPEPGAKVRLTGLDLKTLGHLITTALRLSFSH